MLINKLEDILKILPDDYKEFVKRESLIMENPSNYLFFYKESELMHSNNEIDPDNYFPNLLFIAENELNNGVVYDLRDLKLYCIPYISDEEDAIFIANNFTEFLDKFEGDEIEIY